MKSLLFTLSALAAFALSAPLGGNGTSSNQNILDTDHDLFDISLAQFIQLRGSPDRNENLDWTSDGCTDAPNNPFGFNFLDCCERHDFGYRNYKAQNRFSEPNKDMIDFNFKNDMFGVCENEFLEDECKVTAVVYYEAVHLFGGAKREADILQARSHLAELERSLEDMARTRR